ncbi:MAG: hypothetical protein V4582_15795 [Pseudomonadota bacterium]
MDVGSRISTLEHDIGSIKADLAVIRSNYVTKAELETAVQSLRIDVQNVRTELQKEFNALTWKMYGFGSALVALVYFIARNVH